MGEVLVNLVVTLEAEHCRSQGMGNPTEAGAAASAGYLSCQNC
jgi:hypothetical protein